MRGAGALLNVFCVGGMNDQFEIDLRLFQPNPPGFAVEFECDAVGKSDRFSVAIAP